MDTYTPHTHIYILYVYVDLRSCLRDTTRERNEILPMRSCRLATCDEERAQGVTDYCKRHTTKFRLYRSRGFSQEQFETVMYTTHCEVCNVFLKTPNVDHDHNHCPSGKWCVLCFRGVVCSDCNTLLSYFDRPGILKAAHRYLDLYQSHKPDAVRNPQTYKTPASRDNLGRFLQKYDN